MVVALVGVEPAEDQALVLGIQLGDPAGGGEHQHVALVEAGLLLVADPADVLRLTALVPFDRDPGGGSSGFGDPVYTRSTCCCSASSSARSTFSRSVDVGD